ncbi:MAG: hypothetical protein ACI9NQ_001656 [Paracoccaceae bacterium]
MKDTSPEPSLNFEQRRKKAEAQQGDQENDLKALEDKIKRRPKSK